ncbi:MAG: sigma-70 family RNA polymerase sigma factor [Bacteroidales bacterium]|nr:sigma-70 family RNA polymerase sigma factor [Bacteroidales bacterium]
MTKRTIYSEEMLTSWCARGDRKSQKYLYETYANQMFRLMLRYLGNEQDANDALIVAFTKVLRNIGDFNFRGKGSLSAWIKKIMVNEALMVLRSKKQTESMDDHQHIADKLDAGSSLDAEDIYNLVKELPAGYRTVFNLFIIEGYNHSEIAGMLGISESTSKSQLNKARKKLQEKIIKTKAGYELG